MISDKTRLSFGICSYDYRSVGRAAFVHAAAMINYDSEITIFLYTVLMCSKPAFIYSPRLTCQLLNPSVWFAWPCRSAFGRCQPPPSSPSRQQRVATSPRHIRIVYYFCKLRQDYALPRRRVCEIMPAKPNGSPQPPDLGPPLLVLSESDFDRPLPASSTFHSLLLNERPIFSSHTWTSTSGDLGLLKDADETEDRAIFVQEYNRLAKKVQHLEK